VAPTLKKLRAAYGDKVRVVWKDFPLTQIHPQAFKAGEAGTAPPNRGSSGSITISCSEPAGADADDLKKYAATWVWTPNVQQLPRHVEARGSRAQRRRAGHRLGINSTPTLFVNGRRVSGAQPYEVFAAVIDEELSQNRTPRRGARP
jgi:predicted DsbA family dithiol-disulfide isomerase